MPTWARVLSLVDTEPDSWGAVDLTRLVLIKKKAEETQALAA